MSRAATPESTWVVRVPAGDSFTPSQREWLTRAVRNAETVSGLLFSLFVGVSEEDSRAMKPDYYLALPWHFLGEFLEREKEFLDRGGKFIVPLPEVHEVDGSGQAAPVAPALTAS